MTGGTINGQLLCDILDILDIVDPRLPADVQNAAELRAVTAELGEAFGLATGVLSIVLHGIEEALGRRVLDSVMEQIAAGAVPMMGERS